MRLALAYRRRFGGDVVVDLVGYRRFGHNEQDEAAYTQPLMAEKIASHPTVRELYAERLVQEGVASQADVDELAAGVASAMRQAHEALKRSFGQSIPPKSQDEQIPRDRPGWPPVLEKVLRVRKRTLFPLKLF